MISGPRYLSWDNFSSTVMVRDQQRVHLVTSSPLIEIFGDGERGRIGMSLEVTAKVAVPLELSKLTFISTRTFRRKATWLLEMSTSVKQLHRQFYHFAVAVAERMLGEKMSAADAVVAELGVFSELLAEKAILSTERQIGLIGELLFLERLQIKVGVEAIRSWLGPMGEPHDFRIGDLEFEVKTTVSPQRIHTVHGLEQLCPSRGCTLGLVSILLGPAGAGSGFSLVETIDQLSAGLAGRSGLLDQFTSSLERVGFRIIDREYYPRRYVMRRPVGLVRISDTFPAITRPLIQRALGPDASRIESVKYDVNVDGLEIEDGSIPFDDALPVSI